MSIKNKLAVVGFALVFANLGSVSAQAEQSNLGAHGEFFMISSETIVTTRIFSDGSEFDGVAEYLREALDKKAKEVCSGRTFDIDDSSVKYTSEPVPGHFRSVTVKLTARVLCIDGE